MRIDHPLLVPAETVPLPPNQGRWLAVLVRVRPTGPIDCTPPFPLAADGADARVGVWLGVGIGVRLDPDPYTDPRHHTTGQVNRAVTGRPSAPTDPCLGVSRWGEDAYGRR